MRDQRLKPLSELRVPVLRRQQPHRPQLLQERDQQPDALEGGAVHRHGELREVRARAEEPAY